MGKRPEQLQSPSNQLTGMIRKDLGSANLATLGVTFAAQNPDKCVASQYNNLSGDFAGRLDPEGKETFLRTHRAQPISTFDCECCNIHEVWNHRGKPPWTQESSEDAEKVFQGILDIYDSGRCLARSENKETDGSNP